MKERDREWERVSKKERERVCEQEESVFVNDVGVVGVLLEGVSAVFPVSNAAAVVVNKVQSQFLRVLVQQQLQQQQQQHQRRIKVTPFPSFLLLPTLPSVFETHSVFRSNKFIALCLLHRRELVEDKAFSQKVI